MKRVVALVGALGVVVGIGVACGGEGPELGSQQGAMREYPPPCPPKDVDGRMTGGGSVFLGDLRVTHGFEIRCDETDDRQNLEVNWAEANNFHLTDMVLATCSDNPALGEENPQAGFDTYVGTGTGKLNGVEGATIVFTFTDDGEPGTTDTATMSIFAPGGALVLQVSGPLEKGNHQAHRDTGNGPN